MLINSNEGHYNHSSKRKILAIFYLESNGALVCRLLSPLQGN